MRILVTSGRSFVALEFVRLLRGHEVYVQDCQKDHLCRYSQFVTGCLTTPSPRYDTDGYRASLLEFLQVQKIDLVIPTCEDIFYLARYLEEIRSMGCTVVCDDIEKLLLFHSKSAIIDLAEEIGGIRTPQTMEYRDLDSLRDYLQTHPNFRYVVKPKYSRFANSLSSNVLPHTYPLESLPIDTRYNSYILQEYIAWRSVCSYSLFSRGKLLAHTAYECLLTYGNGSGSFIASFVHKDILAFVRSFGERHDFTGQLAFDYLMTDNEEVFLLECNPRATSGIHLMARDAEFRRHIVEFGSEQPSDSIPYILTHMRKTGFFFVNLLFTFRSYRILRWIESLSYDAVFDWRDIRPFFAQIRLWIYYQSEARRLGIALSAAIIHDIEYNGDLSV